MKFFNKENFKKVGQWIWDNKYYIILFIITIILIITQFKSCQNYKNQKAISDHNIAALNDSIHYYKGKNGELVANKMILIGDIETLKLANADLAQQVKDLKLKKPQTVVIVKTETENQQHDTTWVFETEPCDTTIHKDFDFSDKWRTLSGSINYEDESLSLKIDSDKVYADFTFAVEDGQVFVSSNNPYIKYNDIQGITMPEYEPSWSLVVGPSLSLGYDPLGHSRMKSQNDLPFYIGVGVSLTWGYNIKSGGKKLKTYRKRK